MNLFRRKSVTDLQAEALTDHSLKRALGPINLTALGVGAIIGTGIFVLTGTVAAQHALSAARGTELINIPAALAPLVSAKIGWVVSSASLLDQIKTAGTDPATLGVVTTIFNLPAVLIIFVVTTLLVVGIKESANFNNLI